MIVSSNFLRGLNDEFFQVRSQIMLMEPMPTLVKTFSLILQQECKFNATFILILKTLLPILPLTRDIVKIFAVVSQVIMDGGAFLTLVTAIPNIMTIVTEPFTPLNYWIKHGLPQGYHQNTKVKPPSSKPSASMVDTVLSIVDLHAGNDDKAEAQFEALLSLI